MNKYSWLPSESAMDGYPIQIVSGALRLADGQQVMLANQRVTHHGWGQLGSTHLVGSQEKPVPVSLEVTWFSFREDQFYHIQQGLAVASLEQAFAQKIWGAASQRWTNYQRLIVGLAPQGGVSIWLSVEGVTSEIQIFQGKSINSPWSEIDNFSGLSRREFIDTVLKTHLSEQLWIDYQQHGVVKHLWQKYVQKFDWQLKVSRIQIKYIWISYFNGERHYFDYKQVSPEPRSAALPRQIKIYWQNSEQPSYIAHIDFAEQEVFAAFKQFAGYPEQGISLLLDIDEVTPRIQVILQTDRHFMPFKQCAIRKYFG